MKIIWFVLASCVLVFGCDSSEENQKPGKVAPAETQTTLTSCESKSPSSSDHEMNVEFSKDKNTYIIDFKKAKDRDHKVISLYVSNINDSVPIFPDFKFAGTAYWMLSVDDPFSEYINLPVYYGELPSPMVDVTATYMGPQGGMAIENITDQTCLKFTVITFEPEAQSAFKTSTFLYNHLN